MDLSANATTTILGRAQAAKTAQAVVSPDSPEWLNTDADHYRNPTVEQFKRILEDMRGKANYDALAKLKLLSIGSAPHPVMP